MRWTRFAFAVWAPLALRGLVSTPAAAQETEVAAPAAILNGVPFAVTVRAPGAIDTLEAELRTAQGIVLRVETIAPAGAAIFRDIVVRRSQDLPLTVVVRDEPTTIDRPFLPGWASLLPPIVAIGLALVFHEVVSSLFVGVWLGSLLLAGYNPFAAILVSIERFISPALADAQHAAIVIFSLLLGGMVGLISRMGGLKAIVEAVTPLATTPRRAQFATWLAGLAIFFDDYANTLIVGNTMRPLTDRLRVSREKLAYIVDSTAAPVSAIVFISTWVGYEISLIDDGLAGAASQLAGDPALASQLAGASAFGVFLTSIPYLFYPILAIFTVALFVATRRDFGPMLTAERRASSGNGVFRPGAQLAADMESELGEIPDGVPLRWWNGVIPVVIVIVTVIGGLVWTGSRGMAEAGPEGFNETVRYMLGNTDPFASLLWGSLLGCLAAIGLALGQRILRLPETIAAWVSGMKAMMLAIIILVLAWSLGGVTTELSTGTFLADLLTDAQGASRIPLSTLPAAVFVVSALAAFATGTSWATMAILVPLVIPLAAALGA
ncbi:MAG: Na+/H+ antiporter NhaC family protein, partial [Gemmatimonadales bacterium]